MKCRDCDHCRLGYFKSKPYDYVCIGVKEPFVIYNIDEECSEYPERRAIQVGKLKEPVYVKQEPFVGECGIYIPDKEYVREDCAGYYKMVLSREMFVEAYNKWIKGE